MPKESRAKLRKERRKEQQDNYLAGRATGPYVHTPTLTRSFDDDQPGTSTASSSGEKTICSKCYPVLSRWKDTFKGLIQQGSELKQCKCRNPNPKCSDLQPYRDLNTQNTWLFSTRWAITFIEYAVSVQHSISHPSVFQGRGK